MPRIFISYRHEDAASPAGRLYDNLKIHLATAVSLWTSTRSPRAPTSPKPLRRPLPDAKSYLLWLVRSGWR
jgi:hypothetical protein